MEELLGNDTDETENIKFIPSPYYSHDKFIPVDMNKINVFCILSFKCKSNVICLQETWFKNGSSRRSEI